MGKKKRLIKQWPLAFRRFGGKRRKFRFKQLNYWPLLCIFFQPIQYIVRIKLCCISHDFLLEFVSYLRATDIDLYVCFLFDILSYYVFMFFFRKFLRLLLSTFNFLIRLTLDFQSRRVFENETFRKRSEFFYVMRMLNLGVGHFGSFYLNIMEHILR